MGSNARWYNRHCRRRARFPVRTTSGWNNFARLRLNIAKADLLILFIERQMGMIAAGKLSQRLPGFHRHLAVGFRGEAKK